MAGRKIALLVLSARTTLVEDLTALMPEVLAALQILPQGEETRVSKLEK
jgi:hypothetical protein